MTVSTVLRFLGHQLLSTLGVAMCSVLIIALGQPIHFERLFTYAQQEVFHDLLRVIVGLLFGLVVYGKSHDEGMFWVWILPLVFLLWSMAMFVQGTGLPMAHFWTEPCRPGVLSCTYRLASVPLLAAAAGYAGGAWMSRRRLEDAPSTE